MMKKIRIYRLLPLLALFSCQPKTATDSVVVNGDKVTVVPAEAAEPFRNPMMGLRDVFSVGLDPIPASYPLPFGSMYKEYIPWDRIERNASDGVEQVIAYCEHRWHGIEDRNIKVIPRVYVHWLGTPEVKDPDSLDGVRFPEDLPWGMKEGDPYPMQGGYFDPAFKDRVRKLVAKLGEAWDNDPRVAYVEMGIIGQWGEQHSPMLSPYWKPHDAPVHTDNVTWIPGMSQVLGDSFKAAFKNKKVMVRYAYDFPDYEFGYYWDSWAVAEEDGRGFEEMMKFPDRWKTQPIGGEMCWNWGDLSRYDGLTPMLADEQTRTKIINQIRTLHANHLGYFSYGRPAVDFSQPDLKRNADKLQQALGYHFVIKEFSYDRTIYPGEAFNISLKVCNTGSSPFYYRWPVEISLLDTGSRQKVWATILDDVDIREWMPGDDWSVQKQQYLSAPETYTVDRKVVLDKELPEGRYIIAISVLDPAGNLPSLRFSNRNYFYGGRHPMGYVGVGKEISGYEIAPDSFDSLYDDLTLHYIKD